MRHRTPIIIGGTLAILVLIFVALNIYSQPAPVSERGEPLNEGALPPDKPLAMDEQDLTRIREGYEEPFMQEIRRSLDAYKVKDEEWIASHDWFFDEREGNVNILDELEEQELNSRFVPLSVESALTGGLNVTLLFVNVPDHAYTAWVYPVNEDKDEWELRGFWLNEKVGPELIQWFMNSFEQHKADPRNSL
jgi:hypothetical protein